MNPLVSILLPLFNAGNLLTECFDSIRSQTCQDYEVVAIDDGSTDDTAVQLQQCAREDGRIRVYSLGRNRGITAALNYGLQRCRGDWIARMDADDIMESERLERQWLFMKANPEVDILGCRVSLFRRERALTPGQLRYRDWSNSLLSDDSIKQEIFAESPIMHPTFFLQTKYYSKLNGYRERPWPEDYDFLLRAYLQNAVFAKLPEVLLRKRDHPARVARTDDRCKRKAMFRAKAFYLKQLPVLREAKGLWIMGAGSSGRQMAAALCREGIAFDGFLHHRETEEGKRCMGVPICGLSHRNAGAFLSQNRNAFFLVAVGEPNGRAALEKILANSELRPGIHYYHCI